MFEKFYDEKLKKWATNICHTLELVAAIFVLIGVLIEIIALIPQVGDFWIHRQDADSLMLYLEQTYSIVIGVEFMKMLCRPSADNVLETIIFLVARHMIVNNTTTPLEDLISTISIILLCFMRWYLKNSKEKERRLKLEAANKAANQPESEQAVKQL